MKFHQDNSAVLQVLKAGYSAKLRHSGRAHKVTWHWFPKLLKIPGCLQSTAPLFNRKQTALRRLSLQSNGQWCWNNAVLTTSWPSFVQADEIAPCAPEIVYRAVRMQHGIEGRLEEETLPHVEFLPCCKVITCLTKLNHSFWFTPTFGSNALLKGACPLQVTWYWLCTTVTTITPNFLVILHSSTSYFLLLFLFQNSENWDLGLLMALMWRTWLDSKSLSVSGPVGWNRIDLAKTLGPLGPPWAQGTIATSKQCADLWGQNLLFDAEHRLGGTNLPNAFLPSAKYRGVKSNHLETYIYI